MSHGLECQPFLALCFARVSAGRDSNGESLDKQIPARKFGSKLCRVVGRCSARDKSSNSREGGGNREALYLGERIEWAGDNGNRLHANHADSEQCVDLVVVHCVSTPCSSSPYSRVALCCDNVRCRV